MAWRGKMKRAVVAEPGIPLVAENGCRRCERTAAVGRDLCSKCGENTDEVRSDGSSSLTLILEELQMRVEGMKKKDQELDALIARDESNVKRLGNKWNAIGHLFHVGSEETEKKPDGGFMERMYVSLFNLSPNSHDSTGLESMDTLSKTRVGTERYGGKDGDVSSSVAYDQNLNDDEFWNLIEQMKTNELDSGSLTLSSTSAG